MTMRNDPGPPGCKNREEFSGRGSSAFFPNYVFSNPHKGAAHENYEKNFAINLTAVRQKPKNKFWLKAK
ncbi:hypothetical protein [Microbulbifer sp. DLAB2-AA]|uniref:hypothetical protein n=1 Tax=Microbulbifer sp. DLAB2-AA TaxID=3243394 RepID=UPI004039BA33